LEVRVVTRDDQERTSRRDRYDRRDGPIAEKFLGETVSVKLPGLVDTAEYEAVALVKQRVWSAPVEDNNCPEAPAGLERLTS
jgi:hypothetical protein